LCTPAFVVEADVLQPLVDRVDRRILLLVDRLHVVFAADASSRRDLPPSSVTTSVFSNSML
jgi:hypothetical protein